MEHDSEMVVRGLVAELKTGGFQGIVRVEYKHGDSGPLPAGDAIGPVRQTAEEAAADLNVAMADLMKQMSSMPDYNLTVLKRPPQV